MQHVTIGTKNQIVIPKEVRRKIAGLRPGKKVSIYSIDKDTVVIKAAETDWVARSYGKMKSAWKSTDPTIQVNTMRDEWNEK